MEGFGKWTSGIKLRVADFRVVALTGGLSVTMSWVKMGAGDRSLCVLPRNSIEDGRLGESLGIDGLGASSFMVNEGGVILSQVRVSGVRRWEFAMLEPPSVWSPKLELILVCR